MPEGFRYFVQEARMKKFLAFMVAFGMLAGTMAMAGGKTETPESPKAASGGTMVSNPEKSWETFKNDPVTLSLYVDDKNMDPKVFMEYKALIPKLMKEQTGVTLNIRTAVDQSETSINLMIASGEYPDLMFLDVTRQAAKTLIDNDLIWSFDELKSKFGMDVINRMNINQRFTQRRIFSNDNIYYATAYGFNDTHVNSPWLVKWQTGGYINETLWKGVGSPAIKSMADLMKVAQDIKTKYPRVEFPISVTRNTGTGMFNEAAEFSALRMYYGLNDPSTYWTVGKGYKFYIQAPAFLDMLKDVNKMVNLELISPVMWTGSKNDKMATVFNGIACFELNGDADNFTWYNQELQKKYPNEQYVMLPPFGANAKYQFTTAGTYGSGGNFGWCVPKSAKDPARVAAYIDYMLSDDFQKMNVYGREGIEHTIVDGVPKLTPAILNMETTGTDIAGEYGFNVLGGAVRDNYWQMMQRLQRFDDMRQGIAVLKPAIDKYKDLNTAAENVNLAYPADSEEVKIYSQIKEVFGDELMKILLGPSDKVEASYAALLARVEKMGLQKLADFQNKAALNQAEVIKKYRR